MRRIAGLLAALALAACATPVDPATAYQKFHDNVSKHTDPDGQRIASSAPSTEVQWPVTYNSGGGGGLAVWVMAFKPVSGPTRVILAGSRVRSQLPTESTNDPTGRWDRPEPAYLGSPWRAADFVFTDRETVCFGEGYWCQRRQQFEINLTPDLVKTFISEKAGESIPVALFTRRDIDWRVSRMELLAVLDAVGATDEFR